MGSEIGNLIGLLKKSKPEAVVEQRPISALIEGNRTWRKLSIAIDSGACESVIDPNDVPEVELTETSASRAQEEFQSATGEPIPNMGELLIGMLTREQSFRGMTFTGAPVAQPLGSVKKICRAGHIVVFDEDHSFILSKSTGEVNSLRESEGNYMLDVLLPPNSKNNNDNRKVSFQRQAP